MHTKHDELALITTGPGFCESSFRFYKITKEVKIHDKEERRVDEMRRSSRARMFAHPQQYTTNETNTHNRNQSLKAQRRASMSLLVVLFIRTTQESLSAPLDYHHFLRVVAFLNLNAAGRTCSDHRGTCFWCIYPLSPSGRLRPMPPLSPLPPYLGLGTSLNLF